MPTAYTDIATVRSATGMNDSSLISDALITSKISGATGLVNGKIGTVYSLPLSSVPQLISWITLELTIGLLFIDQYGDESKDSDKAWKKRMDAILSEDKNNPGYLVQIQRLLTQLYDDTTGVELARNTVRQMSFYPTAASSDPSATDSTKPKITVDRKF